MTFFSEKLQESIKAADLSVQALSDALCLHQQHVYKILKGQRRPTNEVLERLANCGLLTVTLTELRGWRAVDDYSDEDILEAIKAIYPDPKALKQYLDGLLNAAAKK